MQGDKLYHKCAREALPLLVRQAKAGEPITYESLAKKLSMPNARNLNYPLGYIGTSLQRLGEEWKQHIPQIQTLVVNKNTRLPGLGIGEFLDVSPNLPPSNGESGSRRSKAKSILIGDGMMCFALSS